MKIKISISRVIAWIYFVLATHVSARESSLFQFVIEPYLQQVADTSFNVLWETNQTGKGTVFLGLAEFNVLKPSFTISFSEKESRIYHNVLVSGLKRGEFYFYKVSTVSDTGDTLVGPVTPKTIPDYKLMPVSFAVIGDTQNSPEIWGRLADLIYQERPSFIVHVGDLVQYGPNKDDWVDEFFKPARNLLRFCPLYPAIGNHEMNNEWFYRYFDLPSPEWFYIVKKGDVLFVFVDTNRDILPGSEQYRKLEKILASSTESWKIMVHHHPVYISGENFYGNTWVQTSAHGDPNEIHLKWLYETYGVDLVLNGHGHFYERTWPLMDGRVDTENGVTYVTTGGGNGEYSKYAANKSWYDARTRIVNHFLYISITDNTLYGRAIDSTRNVFDYWTIEKKGKVRMSAPYITCDKQYFIDSTTAIIQNMNPHGKILYSFGKQNYPSSDAQKVKISLNNTTTVTSFIHYGNQQSHMAEKLFEKLSVFPSEKNVKKDIKADYYEGDWNALPDFNSLKSLKTFTLGSVKLTLVQPRAKDHFAIRFTGSFKILKTDIYRFLLESFDGSKLFIDGKEIISNDGVHFEIKKENFVALEKGMHNFEIQYFDYIKRETLNILIGKQNEEMIDFNTYVYK